MRRSRLSANPLGSRAEETGSYVDRSPQNVSMRNAVAAACSLLIAFVGVVHEVVGSRLYPEGPAEFGGPAGWHLAGLGVVIAGAVLVASTLGLLRAPVRIIAAIISIAGFAIALPDLVQQHFHLFAATLAVSGAGVAILYQAPSAPL